MAYNSAYKGAEIDEAVGAVFKNKEKWNTPSAQNVLFSDGENLQAKYDKGFGGGGSGGGGNGTVTAVNGVTPDKSGNVFLYGEQTETISVVDETITVVQVGNDIGAFIQEMDRSVFVENATFDVSINGVGYMGICSFQAPQTNADGSPPMLIMDASNQVVAMVGFMEGMGNGIFFSGLSVTVGESMPLRITKTVETVQTIPVKYLDIDGIKNAVFASVINAAEEAL
jgi:hypothetical protein